VGTLYLVATPIGNLADISRRALGILEKASLVAAEDTRQTRKLFDHYHIHTPIVSYHEHNKLTRIQPILEALTQGDVALVSDAGTPALNDPGYELVQAVLQAGYPVSPIPGPSAPLAALVASGLPTDAFLYMGYLPRKSSQRQQLLRQISSLPYTLIFLEAPHRLCAALRDVQQALGDRRIAVARELTKLHEEIYRGSVSQAFEYFTQQGARGEFTLVISGSPPAERWPEAQLQVTIEQLLREGASPSQAAGELADLSGWPRREIYQRMIAVQSTEKI
jgi:16S rRNA (cytidine1402-2'-O)-methyltransferase